MIELLINQICNIDVKVEDFSSIRKSGSDYTKTFIIENIIKEASSMPIGKYRFCKGGRIELLDESKWIKIHTFNISDDGITFCDENNYLIDSERVCDAQAKVRLRGPLETVALRQTGSLIDLPWYLDADFSVEAGEDLEFISPISVSSNKRVSFISGGGGNRLFPGGYSLIEYFTPEIENVLKKILNEKEKIRQDDLEDWIRILNNYPASNQKISKSFSSIKAYCDALLRNRFEDFAENAIDIKKMQDYSFVTMGKVLVDMCILLKYFRLFNNEYSKYFNGNNCAKSYYNNGNLREFYDDTIFLLTKCKILFRRFLNDGGEIDDFIQIMDSGDSFWKTPVEDAYIDNKDFYRLVSKLEKSANNILRNYYTIALFISGVLLKANIFSAFCIIGNGKAFRNKVEDILTIRKGKFLSYKPLWYERIDCD